MPNVVKRLARASLTTSSATVYTVPASTTAVVTNIVLTNTSSTVLTGTVRLAGVDILSAVTVPANGIFAFDLKQVMDAAETVTALSSGTGLRLHISGLEIS